MVLVVCVTSFPTCLVGLRATCVTENSNMHSKKEPNTSDDDARCYKTQSSITMTSPNVSTCLLFPPRVAFASTSPDRSITLPDAGTSLRLLVPRVRGGTASIPSLVKSTPIACCSVASSGPADCLVARPFPLAEVRFVVADAIDEVGFEDTVEGGGGGGGAGLAYNSVHWRAV